MNDFCHLMPGLTFERGFVGAPGCVGADWQALATFAAAIVFPLELFERGAETVALQLVELVSGGATNDRAASRLGFLPRGESLGKALDDLRKPHLVNVFR